MLSVMPRKAHQVVAMLLVCVALGAIVVCQFHMTPSDHGHDAPGTHHPTPSAHSMLDSSCLMAVLPAIIFIAFLVFFPFYAAPLWLKHAPPTFPPFIPPRHAAC